MAVSIEGTWDTRRAANSVTIMAKSEAIRAGILEILQQLRPDCDANVLEAHVSLTSALRLKSVDLVSLGNLLYERFGFDFGMMLEDLDALERLDTFVELVARKATKVEL